MINRFPPPPFTPARAPLWASLFAAGLAWGATAPNFQLPPVRVIPPPPVPEEAVEPELDANFLADAPVLNLPATQKILQAIVVYPGDWKLDPDTGLDIQLINLSAATTNQPIVWVSAQIVRAPTNFPLVVELPYGAATYRKGEEWGIRARVTKGKGTIAATARLLPVIEGGKVVESITVPLVPIPSEAP